MRIYFEDLWNHLKDFLTLYFDSAINRFYHWIGTFNLSFAFVVISMFFLLLYMFYRNIKHTSFLGVLAFLTECVLLTVATMALIEKVLVIPSFELLFVGGGIVLPIIFLLKDFHSMKWRVRISMGPVHLVEKAARKLYIELGDDWTVQMDPPGAFFSADEICKSISTPDNTVLQNAKDQLKEAEEYIQDLEFEKAYHIYTFLTNLLPLDAAGYCNAGWLHFIRENPDGAMKMFKKAASLSSKEQKAFRVKNSKDYYSKTAWFSRFGMGCAYFSLESYEDALFEFQKASLLNGTSPALLLNMARCHLLLNNPDIAREELEKALEYDGSPKTRIVLAKLLLELNVRESAISHLETLISTERNSPEAWEILGNLYRQERDWENAEPLYAHLAKLKPDSPDVWFRLASCRRHINKMEDALAAYRTAIHLKPDFSRALYGAAATLEENNEKKEAITLLRKALAGNEPMEKTYNLLGNIFQAEGRLREAVTIYEEAVARFPESGLLHANYGAAQSLAGFSDRAIKPLKTAIKLGETDAETYTILAKALFDVKHPHEAVRVLKEGTSENIENSDLWYLSARAKAKCHDTEGAIEDLETAVGMDEDLRFEARSCSDFSTIRTAPGFIDLIRLPMLKERKSG